jgi:hypothetical protein
MWSTILQKMNQILRAALHSFSEGAFAGDLEGKRSCRLNSRCRERKRRNLPMDEITNEAQAAMEELMPRDVYTLLKVLITTLAQQAWIFMGLQMNPFTNSVTKDIVQAKLAIDSAIVLLEKLSEHLEPAERQEYQTIIQNLQLNFFQQSES